LVELVKKTSYISLVAVLFNLTQPWVSISVPLLSDDFEHAASRMIAVKTEINFNIV
jgi:hypothetical protein